MPLADIAGGTVGMVVDDHAKGTPRLLIAQVTAFQFAEQAIK
jgi:hypothetical protein